MDAEMMMKFVDAQVEAEKAKDAANRGHMTLGHLIDVLALLPPDMTIVTDQGSSLGNPNSYRGYYEQLSFIPIERPRLVSDVLMEARAADGETYMGYRGGEYRMSRGTWIWLAEYGRGGRPIVGIEMRDGAAVILTAEGD